MMMRAVEMWMDMEISNRYLYKFDPEKISAAFHYVAENKTVRPEKLLEEAEIIQALPRWGDDR